MNNSYKTQYVKASVAKMMRTKDLQVGQWVPEDQMKFLSEGHKLKRAYLKKNGDVKFSHGENLGYYTVMKQATRMRMLFVNQPLQVEEAISQFPTRKLVALKGICEFEINSRKAEQI